ncbi:transposase [Actinomyces stomatis]|uniref:transposase n=1 Tax=Actinomyces stomatis TaxID=3050227 RepID=UPI002852A5F9|nr:transposase [Actinomyces sp. PK606]
MSISRVVMVNRPGFDGGSDDTEGSLSWDLRKYPDELRERATRMALDALADPARARGAIRRIADELGVHPEALRTWVKKAQVDQGTRPGTTTDEAQRIKELEKEIRELRRANAILKSTVGLSIAAECERPSLCSASTSRPRRRSSGPGRSARCSLAPSQDAPST